MPKRPRSVSTYSNAAYKRPRATGSSLPASVSQVGLVRAAKAYAPTRVPRGLSGFSPGFPSSKVVNMRYVSWFAMVGGSGVLARNTFRANSIFDPDYDGVGHQPLGHDQWAAFYSHYTVLSSTCKIMVQPTSTVTSPAMVGMFVSDVPTISTATWDATIEQGRGVYAMTPMGPVAAKPTTLRTLKYDAKSFHNVQDVKDNQDRIGAEFGTNPPTAGDAFFIVWAQSQDQAVACNIDCTVIIDYKVLVSDPNQLATS